NVHYRPLTEKFTTTVSLTLSGSRQSIIPECVTGFWFVTQAHPPVHIGICTGGCNAEGRPKDQRDLQLFFAGAPAKAINLSAFSLFSK
ncbi:MAG TPA: hypothetical protein VK852_13830, partial [Desulfobacterales bacterium]|nr:hypothetical protein [Desulfobacterales bacterium]